ncbi:hypothetical protein [Sodalis sp.]|uniref:hypothetical protein n=1 Tax=Sodalis sp. (in: enterobacteria) TaxID=1898979 RepID=UPI00387374D7
MFHVENISTVFMHNLTKVLSWPDSHRKGAVHFHSEIAARVQMALRVILTSWVELM